MKLSKSVTVEDYYSCRVLEGDHILNDQHLARVEGLCDTYTGQTVYRFTSGPNRGRTFIMGYREPRPMWSTLH